MTPTDLIHVAYNNPLVPWYWPVFVITVLLFVFIAWKVGWFDTRTWPQRTVYEQDKRDNYIIKIAGWSLVGMLVALGLWTSVFWAVDTLVQREAIAATFGCIELLDTRNDLYEYMCVTVDKTFPLASLPGSNFIIPNP